MGLSFPFHNGNVSFFRYRSRLQDWGVVGRVVHQPLSSDVAFLMLERFCHSIPALKWILVSEIQDPVSAGYTPSRGFLCAAALRHSLFLTELYHPV